MVQHTPQVLIGTSGYQYDHWQGSFYPDGLKKADWLAFYCDHFPTVEINSTFYNLPKPETFRHWRKKTPNGFHFAVKFSRYGTHMKKLKDPKEVLDNFLNAAEMLQDKLGPILVQLPPHWSANPARLDEFLEETPRKRLFAVEFRDPSWLIDEVYEVLEKHGAALCVHDLIEAHPDRVTTDWVYYRFHGKNYGGEYSPQKLSAVADVLAAHHDAGRDVYVYFNNDLGGHAIHNAMDLQKYVDNRL